VLHTLIIWLVIISTHYRQGIPISILLLICSYIHPYKTFTKKYSWYPTLSSLYTKIYCIHFIFLLLLISLLTHHYTYLPIHFLAVTYSFLIVWFRFSKNVYNTFLRCLLLTDIVSVIQKLTKRPYVLKSSVILL